MKNVWFSSDYHLGHVNIVKYDERPFKNIHVMNELIISNHNARVAPDDDFYYLGDFSFNDKRTEEWLQRLQGNKYFIRGNHDRPRTVKLYRKYGEYLGDLWNGQIDGRQMTLCHYALRVWNKCHRGSIHLYGHSHGNLEDLKTSLSMDVGIMCHNYLPISMMEVESVMSDKEFIPIDHHGRKSRDDDD